MSLTKSYFLVFGLYLLGGCSDFPLKPDLNNPYDSDSPTYVEPHATINQYPADIIAESFASISWAGNAEGMEYAVRLDDYDFSPWYPDTSAELRYLDDGPHLFEVKARYPTGQEETASASVSFTVDAVPGQSLVLYPYGMPVSSSDTLTVYVLSDSIYGIAGIELEISYDAAMLEPLDVTGGELFEIANTTPLILDEIGQSWTIIAAALGEQSILNGSSTLLVLRFINKSPGSPISTPVALGVTDVRNYDDESITLRSVRGMVLYQGTPWDIQ